MTRTLRTSNNADKHAHLPSNERPGAYAIAGVFGSDEDESSCSTENNEGLSVPPPEPLVTLDAEAVDEMEEQEQLRQLEEERRAFQDEEQRVQEMESELQQVEQLPTVEATPVRRQERQKDVSKNNLVYTLCCKSRRRNLSVFFLMILVAIAVGVSLGVVFGKRDTDEDGNGQVPSLPPANQPPATPSSSPTTEPSTSSYWRQRGQALLGEAEYDDFGLSIAISADGMTVAAGTEKNDGNGRSSGHVRVFEFDPNSKKWIQLGQDIDGEAAYDYFGSSVALSADGKILAAGAIDNASGYESGYLRLYQYDQDADSWYQLGQDLDGEAAGDSFGWSVALSANGMTVAAGSPYNNGNGRNSGHVRVYTFNQSSNRWTQLGQDIDGKANYDFFGRSVSLSADGNILAAGASQWRSNAAGYVRLFHFERDQWKPLGQDLEGGAEADRFGTSVALSSSGTTVATGNPQCFSANCTGYVRIFGFNYSSHIWNQIGQDLNGQEDGDRFGHSVALSADGTIVAAGSRGDARVFQYDSPTNQWQQLGTDQVNLDQDYSCTVALSADGSVLAVGTTLGAHKSFNGVVQVFDTRNK